MTTRKKKPKLYPFEPDWCLRPGVHLQEMLDHAGLSPRLGVSFLTKLTGMSEETVRGVLDGSVEITPEIAARLATGTQPLAVSAQFWLNAEAIYRSALARGAKDVSDE